MHTRTHLHNTPPKYPRTLGHHILDVDYTKGEPFTAQARLPGLGLLQLILALTTFCATLALAAAVTHTFISFVHCQHSGSAQWQLHFLHRDSRHSTRTCVLLLHLCASASRVISRTQSLSNNSRAHALDPKS